MEKLTIVARAEVIPGKEKEFLSQAEILINATRAEKGNMSYTLYQNPFHPTSFIFYEEYRDQTSIREHSLSDHFKAFSNAIKDLLAAKLNIESF